MTGTKLFTLFAASQLELHSWIDAITSVISNLKGKNGISMRLRSALLEGVSWYAVPRLNATLTQLRANDRNVREIQWPFMVPLRFLVAALDFIG